MSTTKTEMQQRFADALRVQTAQTVKQASIIQTRLVELGFGQDCARCWGSGHYSYNPMHGTVCFGCSGRGRVARKLTAKLLDEIAALPSEQIEAAIAAITERVRVRKLVETASSRVMSAWQASGVSAAYKWTNAYPSSRTYSERDEYIADTFNKPMHDAYDRIEKLAASVQFAAAKKSSNDPELLAAQRDLVEQADAAVAQINALAEQLRSHLAA
jgi:hypothetical protein